MFLNDDENQEESSYEYEDDEPEENSQDEDIQFNNPTPKKEMFYTVQPPTPI